MGALRDYAAAIVHAALVDELPGANPTELRERAESLIAIADMNGLDLQVLIRWIRERVPGKDWSLIEFRNFAAQCLPKSLK